MNWTEMKLAVEEQMLSDPQRATLSTRAWTAVEEGLRHLESVGYSFELAPKGALALSREPAPGAKSLTLPEAKAKVAPRPVDPVVSKFQALTASPGE